MSLGSYESEVGRGNLLNALAHPSVINPAAAIGNAVQTARGITDLRAAQFNLQQAQLAPVYQSMRMLAATNPNPGSDDVLAALGGAARIGGNVDGVTQNLADWTARGGKVPDFVRAYAAGGMAPENQGTVLQGVGETQNTGAALVSGIRGGIYSAAPGQFQPGSSVQIAPSPEWSGTRVPVVGPDGKIQMVPQGALQGSGGGAAGGAGTGAGAAVNNFGNIRAPGGGFASFNTPQDGIAAMTGLLGSYQDNQGISTLNGITARWAPKGDGANDPVAYANTVSKLTGIDPNAPLNLHDPATLAKIIPAMAQVEHGRPMGVGGDVLSAGITAGLSGGRPTTSQPGAPQQPPGPFVGVTSAQPVTSPGANVRPAGGVQSYDPYGRPIVPGGGGGAAIPGVGPMTPSGAILTPPPPWMGPIWEQSAKEYSTDVSREAGLAQRIQPWQSALSILKANPNLSTGPTSQQWNNWATTLGQYGVQLPSMPGGSVAAYQELSKALHQGLVNSGAFSGTDMARIEAEASSPNMQQQAEAIRELSARQIGYERFQMARLKYFRSLHPGEDPDQSANQYRSQTSTWASNLDPVAFGADNLSPQEIADYRKGLTPQQDDRFLRSIKAAHSLYPEITPGGQ